MATGVPTFDALSGDLEPYPTGALLRLREEHRRRDRTALSVREYFTFYLDLPEHPRSKAEAEVARRQLDALKRTHPRLVAMYPADDMMGMAYHLIRYIETERTEPN